MVQKAQNNQIIQALKTINPYFLLQKIGFIMVLPDQSRIKISSRSSTVEHILQHEALPQQRRCYEACPFLRPCSSPWNQTRCGGCREALQGSSRLPWEHVRLGAIHEAVLQAQVFRLCYWSRRPVCGPCQEALVWLDVDTPRATWGAKGKPHDVLDTHRRPACVRCNGV